jgi:uncharacterized protein (TIGR02246 family)
MKNKWERDAAMIYVSAVVMALNLVFTSPAAAADGSQRKQDEAAIRQASQAFARAFEKGDAKAVADFFTENGEYVDEDQEPIRGRTTIEKAYKKFFGDREDVKVEGATDNIRFLGRDTATEEGTFTVRAKKGAGTSARYSTLFVRENGRWLIAMLKEWEDDSTRRPSLKDLEWIIGTWQSDTDEQQVRTTYDWTENKSFIRCRFTIMGKKDKALASSGTQMIGIDPTTNRVRAWIFDGDGGFGESLWSWDGDRWVIDSEGTLSDGSRTTAVNFLARSGDNAFTWRSVERTLDGESLPDVGSVKVTRVATETPDNKKSAPRGKGR